MFTDRMLKCSECAIEFAFTAAEQQFWEERAFRFPPRRCKDCRRKRRDSGPEGGSAGAGGAHPAAEGAHAGSRSSGGSRPPRDASQAPRELHPATCSQCGGETTVPFKPDPARATFCRDCYAQRRG